LTVEPAVEYTPYVETIQVVLDKPLLVAANRLAKKSKVNRSVLIRRALRDYLKRQRHEALVEQERRSYLEHPDPVAEAEAWAKIAAWPED
jgi:metal-responsive CopG/Arc/MetJ family transcriptional regulator